jgi:hypothetical protein
MTVSQFEVNACRTAGNSPGNYAAWQTARRDTARNHRMPSSNAASLCFFRARSAFGRGFVASGLEGALRVRVEQVISWSSLVVVCN